MLLLAFPLSAFSTPFHVVIDAGHGGSDAGATRNGIREADVVLQVSQSLVSILKKDKNFKVTTTRTSNTQVGLKERAQIANLSQADLFVSIHANASRDRRVQGAEFYLQNHLAPSEEAQFLAAREEGAETDIEIQEQMASIGKFDTDSPEVLTILDDLVRSHRIVQSDSFAAKIAKNWKSIGKTKKTAIRQAPFYLVSNVSMPSVLVELGYLSNSKESKKLRSQSYQKKMAQNLYQSILQYKKTVHSTN